MGLVVGIAVVALLIMITSPRAAPRRRSQPLYKPTSVFRADEEPLTYDELAYLMESVTNKVEGEKNEP